MVEEETISFTYVTSLFVESKKGGQAWVKVFAMAETPEDIEAVKKQINRGNEAMATLDRMRKYYEKETE